MITIGNRGQTLVETNYFETDHAARGLFYLSWNAGCARLLVPDNHVNSLVDMSCDHVILTVKKDRIDIMFDDLSEYPYCITISPEQSDRVVTPGDCVFAVYDKVGEKYKFSCIIK